MIRPLLACAPFLALCLLSLQRAPAQEPIQLGGPPQLSDVDWVAVKAEAIANVHVASGWEPARLVEGTVNTSGWEDSPSISADGQELHFAYFAGDLMNWAYLAQADPYVFAGYKRGPGRGVYPEFTIDAMIAHHQGPRWIGPERADVSLATNPSWTAESGPFLAADGRLYYNWNWPASETDSDVDIYRDGQRLSFNTSVDDLDPHYMAGELLFWTEQRPGCYGRKQIWLTTETEAKTGPDQWTAPAALPAPVNLPDSDAWQPHLTGTGVLYFSSDREGYTSIYASTRLGPNTWGTPARIVWPESYQPAVACAEPTLTGDGQYLYFAVLFKNQLGQFDLDIAYTRRSETVVASAPEYQLNSASATLMIDGVASTPDTPGVSTKSQGSAGVLKIESTSVGLGWELILVPTPIVPAIDGGCRMESGQILNLRINGPGLVFLHGGLLPWYVPFEGDQRIDFVTPQTVGTVSIQSVHLDPGYPDGFVLSQACQLSVR